MMKKFFPDNVHVQTRIHSNHIQTTCHQYLSPIVHLVGTIRVMLHNFAILVNAYKNYIAVC
jgi:hypothetical protein